MTGPATVQVGIVWCGLETRLRHDGKGVDVYDRSSEDPHTWEPSLFGHIVPAAEGHEAIRARGDLEAAQFGTVRECLEWLAGPLSARWPQRLDHDIARLHATVGQMTERSGLGQTEHIVRLAEEAARIAALIGASAQAINDTEQAAS